MYSAKHVIIKIVHWTTDMQLHKRMEASNIYLRGLHDYQDIKADGTLNLMAIIISDGPQTFSLICSDYSSVLTTYQWHGKQLLEVK